jgi:hypothetical protein
MRIRIACLLAVTVAVGLRATVNADDSNSQQQQPQQQQQSHGLFPIFRPRTKPTTTTAPAAQATVQVAASEPVLAPPPANAAPAPMPMPNSTVVVAPPATGTPCVNVSEPDAGYTPPAMAYPFATCHQGRLGQREVDFSGCISVQGYWRFFCGGARSFWREGRHEPDAVNGCYCGSR